MAADMAVTAASAPACVFSHVPWLVTSPIGMRSSRHWPSNNTLTRHFWGMGLYCCGGVVAPAEGIVERYGGPVGVAGRAGITVR